MIIITVKVFLKTSNGKKIIFLTNENLNHVKSIKKLIFKSLYYFERLFSKKEFTYITLLKLKYDVILKLISNSLTFKLFKYKTLIKYILLENKQVKKLFI